MEDNQRYWKEEVPVQFRDGCTLTTLHGLTRHGRSEGIRAIEGLFDRIYNFLCAILLGVALVGASMHTAFFTVTGSGTGELLTRASSSAAISSAALSMFIFPGPRSTSKANWSRACRAICDCEGNSEFWQLSRRKLPCLLSFPLGTCCLPASTAPTPRGPAPTYACTVPSGVGGCPTGCASGMLGRDRPSRCALLPLAEKVRRQEQRHARSLKPPHALQSGLRWQANPNGYPEGSQQQGMRARPCYIRRTQRQRADGGRGRSRLPAHGRCTHGAKSRPSGLGPAHPFGAPEAAPRACHARQARRAPPPPSIHRRTATASRGRSRCPAPLVPVPARAAGAPGRSALRAPRPLLPARGVDAAAAAGATGAILSGGRWLVGWRRSGSEDDGMRLLAGGATPGSKTWGRVGGAARPPGARGRCGRCLECFGRSLAGGGARAPRPQERGAGQPERRSPAPKNRPETASSGAALRWSAHSLSRRGAAPASSPHHGGRAGTPRPLSVTGGGLTWMHTVSPGDPRERQM
eukprot:scaffold1883_cov396-Prasinococcus_capsulatus_cf.AAC.39